MKVVIVHYHLNPGGVTRIIGSQIRGLQTLPGKIELCVLCGNDRGESDIPQAIIQVHPALDYLDYAMSEENFLEAVQVITAVLKRNLTGEAILHVHNANLGKNPALTLAVYELAKEGYPVINHSHDFPEARPRNMELLGKWIPEASLLPLSEILYPPFPGYHFISLNSCDYRQIIEKGMDASRIHLLPNPVSFQKLVAPSGKHQLRRRICKVLGFDPSRKICTYPVRAIARKNLGEFLLLAVLFRNEASFTITLPPKNPLELTGYERWKGICLHNGIDVKFESGVVVDHEELICISDFCITTSAREGFGMVYLEPWLAGTPVIGRDLPCVTNDLIAQGLEFPRLYGHILIETPEGMIDFKDLPKDDQEMTVIQLASQEPARNKLLRNNTCLTNFLEDIPAEVIYRNQQIVENKFSPEKYGAELLAIYHKVSE